MSVRYKFKNDLEYSTLPCDGFHISVRDLKRAIVRTKKLGRVTDFDLNVTNHQTKEVHSKDEDLIPKNSTLIVARVPLPAGQKRVWEEEKLPLATLSNPVGGGGSLGISGGSFSNVSGGDNDTEDDKLNIMMSNSTEMYHEKHWAKMRGTRYSHHFPKRLPSSYRCKLCGIPGHWMADCPQHPVSKTFGSGVKPTTGIPRSFLKHADSLTPGAKINPQGMFMVNEMEKEAYSEKKIDKPVWEQDEIPLTSASCNSNAKVEIPDDLKCPICKDILRDAIMMPMCACPMCDECARDALVETGTKKCPVCGEPDNSPDELIPWRQVRDKVNRFKATNNYGGGGGGGNITGENGTTSTDVPPTSLYPAKKKDDLRPPKLPDIVLPKSDVTNFDQQVMNVGGGNNVEKSPHHTNASSQVVSPSFSAEPTQSFQSLKSPPTFPGMMLQDLEPPVPGLDDNLFPEPPIKITPGRPRTPEDTPPPPRSTSHSRTPSPGNDDLKESGSRSRSGSRSPRRKTNETEPPPSTSSRSRAVPLPDISQPPPGFIIPRPPPPPHHHHHHHHHHLGPPHTAQHLPPPSTPASLSTTIATNPYPSAVRLPESLPTHHSFPTPPQPPHLMHHHPAFVPPPHIMLPQQQQAAAAPSPIGPPATIHPPSVVVPTIADDPLAAFEAKMAELDSRRNSRRRVGSRSPTRNESPLRQHRPYGSSPGRYSRVYRSPLRRSPSQGRYRQPRSPRHSMSPPLPPPPPPRGPRTPPHQRDSATPPPPRSDRELSGIRSPRGGNSPPPPLLPRHSRSPSRRRSVSPPSRRQHYYERGRGPPLQSYHSGPPGGRSPDRSFNYHRGQSGGHLSHLPPPPPYDDRFFESRGSRFPGHRYGSSSRYGNFEPGYRGRFRRGGKSFYPPPHPTNYDHRFPQMPPGEEQYEDTRHLYSRVAPRRERVAPPPLSPTETSRERERAVGGYNESHDNVAPPSSSSSPPPPPPPHVAHYNNDKEDNRWVDQPSNSRTPSLSPEPEQRDDNPPLPNDHHHSAEIKAKLEDRDLRRHDDGDDANEKHSRSQPDVSRHEDPDSGDRRRNRDSGRRLANSQKRTDVDTRRSSHREKLSRDYDDDDVDDNDNGHGRSSLGRRIGEDVDLRKGHNHHKQQMKDRRERENRSNNRDRRRRRRRHSNNGDRGCEKTRERYDDRSTIAEDTNSKHQEHKERGRQRGEKISSVAETLVEKKKDKRKRRKRDDDGSSPDVSSEAVDDSLNKKKKKVKKEKKAKSKLNSSKKYREMVQPKADAEDEQMEAKMDNNDGGGGGSEKYPVENRPPSALQDSYDDHLQIHNNEDLDEDMDKLLAPSPENVKETTSDNLPQAPTPSKWEEGDDAKGVDNKQGNSPRDIDDEDLRELLKAKSSLGNLATLHKVPKAVATDYEKEKNVVDISHTHGSDDDNDNDDDDDEEEEEGEARSIEEDEETSCSNEDVLHPSKRMKNQVSNESGSEKDHNALSKRRKKERKEKTKDRTKKKDKKAKKEAKKLLKKLMKNSKVKNGHMLLEMLQNETMTTQSVSSSSKQEEDGDRRHQQKSRSRSASGSLPGGSRRAVISKGDSLTMTISEGSSSRRRPESPSWKSRKSRRLRSRTPAHVIDNSRRHHHHHHHPNVREYSKSRSRERSGGRRLHRDEADESTRDRVGSRLMRLNSSRVNIDDEGRPKKSVKDRLGPIPKPQGDKKRRMKRKSSCSKESSGCFSREHWNSSDKSKLGKSERGGGGGGGKLDEGKRNLGSGKDSKSSGNERERHSKGGHRSSSTKTRRDESTESSRKESKRRNSNKH